MSQGARPGVGRRAALGIALGTAATALSACGVRLEDDAPRVPLVPTRTPVPAEVDLVALTRDTDRLAQLAASLGGDLGADLAVIHARQHAVLRTTLVRDQVPAEGLDAGPLPAPTAPPAAPPTAGPTGTPPTSPTGTPSPTSTASVPAIEGPQLAQREAAAASGSGSFAEVAAGLRAPVAALHAQRYAAATLLMGQPPAVPSDPVTGEDVAALAGCTSAATWFLEVVTARAAGAQRVRAEATLDALRGLLADQVAGGSRPPDTLGHPLPFPVRTPADGVRLAGEALTALRSQHGAALEGLVTGHGASGAQGATRWLGTIEVEAHRWGVALAPFPGLT
ncbi:MAG: hypothetical protein ABIU87_12185 [Ornithinibacter sp.]